MSIDFGGKIIVKAKKESLQALNNIEDIFYIQDNWSDNKCSPSQGYFRKAIIFETKDYRTCYIVDNSIFSGFVNSERILVINKKTNEKINYKLEKQNETKDISFSSIINNSYELNDSDYKYIKEYSYDEYEDFSEDEEFENKHIPHIYIINNDEDYIIVDATINEAENYIIFKFDQDKLINVIYCNKESLNIDTMEIKEVNDDEYINALMRANDALSIARDEMDNYFTFDKTIQFKLDEIKIKSIDIDSDDDEYDESNELCEVMLPYIPKLNIAEYKDNTLTMPKCCSFISQYLVKFILHSLGITSDKDLNNYYYRDDCLKILKLKLVIPGSVKTIDYSAFINKWFDSIIINEGVEVIGPYAFANCNAREIKLPSTIDSIYQNAFRDNFIKEICLPNKLKYISGDTFADCCYLSKISIDENNEYYKTNDSNNVLIEKKEERLIIALENALIPEGVKIIGNGCFSWLRAENELVIPNGVEKIEDKAFSTCSYTNIVFPETLIEIGSSAFWQCDKIEKIVFPKSLRKIGDLSFTSCYNLKEVYFNSSVDIGRYCFSSKIKLFDRINPMEKDELAKYTLINEENEGTNKNTFLNSLNNETDDEILDEENEDQITNDEDLPF